MNGDQTRKAKSKHTPNRIQQVLERLLGKEQVAEGQCPGADWHLSTVLGDPSGKDYYFELKRLKKLWKTQKITRRDYEERKTQLLQGL